MKRPPPRTKPLLRKLAQKEEHKKEEKEAAVGVVEVEAEVVNVEVVEANVEVVEEKEAEEIVVVGEEAEAVEEVDLTMMIIRTSLHKKKGVMVADLEIEEALVTEMKQGMLTMLTMNPRANLGVDLVVVLVAVETMMEVKGELDEEDSVDAAEEIVVVGEEAEAVEEVDLTMMIIRTSLHKKKGVMVEDLEIEEALVTEMKRGMLTMMIIRTSLHK